MKKYLCLFLVLFAGAYYGGTKYEDLIKEYLTYQVREVSFADIVFNVKIEKNIPVSFAYKAKDKKLVLQVEPWETLIQSKYIPSFVLVLSEKDVQSLLLQKQTLQLWQEGNYEFVVVPCEKGFEILLKTSTLTHASPVSTGGAFIFYKRLTFWFK